MHDQSEVARLTRQIAAEYASASQGLTGYAEGVARHRVIKARMEQAGRTSQELINTVGYASAKPLIMQAMEGTT